MFSEKVRNVQVAITLPRNVQVAITLPRNVQVSATLPRNGQLQQHYLEMANYSNITQKWVNYMKIRTINPIVAILIYELQ